MVRAAQFMTKCYLRKNVMIEGDQILFTFTIVLISGVVRFLSPNCVEDVCVYFRSIMHPLKYSVHVRSTGMAK